MSDLKHVGRIKSNGKKCLVAYRTLPADPYNCLVILTETLTDAQHDSLINLVESNAGQSAYEFAEALARTSFPDGSIMLAALHTQARMIKVPTDDIEMTPRPGVAVSLAEINQYIAAQQGVTLDQLALKSSDPKPADESVEIATVNEIQQPEQVVDTTLNIDPSMSVEQQAKLYRSQADKLAKEAAKFRRLAEELQPTVKKRKSKTAA